MTQGRQLRGFSIVLLVGAGLMVLGQLVAWPPEAALERILTGLTVAVVLLAVSLTVYVWRHDRRRHRQRKHP